MRLSNLMRAGMAALTVLALVSVASLLFVQNYLAGTVASLDMNLQSVRAAQGLELAILEHALTANRYLFTGDPAFREERDRFAREIDVRLREVHQYAEVQREAELLARVEVELGQYFAARRKLEGELGQIDPRAETFNRLDNLIHQLDLQLREVVAINLEQAEVARGDVARMRRIVENVAVALLVANLLLVAIIALFGKRVLFSPLRHTRDLAANLGDGEKRKPLGQPALVEIREIEEALNSAAQRLRDQREQELGFLAGVAHDLRNPLSALRLATASLRPDRPLPEETKLKALAGLVDRQIGRLDRLVGDLLDATRIQAGQLELKKEPRSVAQLASGVVELFRESSQRPISCKGEECAAEVDPVRIEQVITNLVSNALKYSPETSPVEVEILCGSTEILVRVRDYGIGIPSDELESVFEPFRRARGTRETVPGVGLGLSVSRRIAEAHGGSIEVESRPGEGSTFTLRLPAAS